jgi:hypothetical protein
MVATWIQAVWRGPRFVDRAQRGEWERGLLHDGGDAEVTRR